MTKQDSVIQARQDLTAMGDDALPIYVEKLSDGSWHYTFDANPHGTYERVTL
jgi:hypothetical protein